MLLSCLRFGIENLSPKEIRNKKVIEVGSYDVNGSLRHFVESLAPAEYIGVDILMGPGVDVICSAEELEKKFGLESFDVVIATELLEHVRDWRKAVSNLKRVCRLGGIILITSPSRGFGYHGYPSDFWRYEKKDMERIFSDCQILALERNPSTPGVFLKCQKPAQFTENNLFDYQLYSIVVGRKIKKLKEQDFHSLRFLCFSLLGRIVTSFPIKFFMDMKHKKEKKKANHFLIKLSQS